MLSPLAQHGGHYGLALLSLNKLVFLHISTKKQMLIEAKGRIFSGDQRDLKNKRTKYVGKSLQSAEVINL